MADSKGFYGCRHTPRDSNKEEHKICLRGGNTAYRIQRVRRRLRQQRYDLTDMTAPMSWEEWL